MARPGKKKEEEARVFGNGRRIRLQLDLIVPPKKISFFVSSLLLLLLANCTHRPRLSDQATHLRSVSVMVAIPAASLLVHVLQSVNMMESSRYVCTYDLSDGRVHDG